MEHTDRIIEGEILNRIYITDKGIVVEEVLRTSQAELHNLYASF
jgi:hypothetical protein